MRTPGRHAIRPTEVVRLEGWGSPLRIAWTTPIAGGKDPAVTAARFDDRIYYEDQSSWTSDDYYALFRYLNRMLLNSRGAKTGEIAALDLSRTTLETRYLIKHMLLLTKRYERMLEEFPNLKPLDDVGELGHELVLDEDPTYAYPYFTERGILL